MDIFHSFTACSQFSFQIGCSFEEIVTIRATKGLEDCVDIAHVTYMVLVSRQSDSVFVFLRTPPSELTYDVPLNIIDILEKNFE